MELCEKLQELRKRRALTQEELAAALYVSRTAISKWESGRGYPNIDSLKAISRFFGVTIDDLLSGEELLSLAEEAQQQQAANDRNLVFALLDISMALFLFLPVFGQNTDGAMRSVSLTALTGFSAYLTSAYWLIIIAMIASGTAILLRKDAQSVWMQHAHKLSLLLGAAAVLLFIISRQPYAAVFAFVFLIIKTLMLLKHP